MSVLLRPMGEADKGFVFSSWLRSYRSFWPPRPYFADAGTWRALTEKRRNDPDRLITWGEQMYRHAHRPAIDAAMQRGTTWIACDREQPDVIYGFICYEGATLHYVYVAKVMRGQGIARLLLDTVRGAMWCSHMTTRGAKIARALKMRYKPARLWRTDEETARVASGVQHDDHDSGVAVASR